MTLKAYIASGWFSEDQEVARLKIINSATTANFEIYSPKDEDLFSDKHHRHTSHQVFNKNLFEIKVSKLVIASTVGKDMGTLFECGYAFAFGVPIVYFYPHTGKFNLMLAESAHAVFKESHKLTEYLCKTEEIGIVKKIKYKGGIE